MGRGYEGEKILVYLKRAPHFWLSIQNFIFPEKKILVVLGGGVVWPAWGGGVRQSPPPPPLWISTFLRWLPGTGDTRPPSRAPAQPPQAQQPPVAVGPWALSLFRAPEEGTPS